MPGGPAAGVGERRAARDEIRRRQRRVRRRARRLPGTRADQRHRVEAERPRPGPGCRRHQRLEPAHQPRVREDVRDDLVLPGVIRQPCRLPVGPGRGEEREQAGIVNGLERGVVVRRRGNLVGAGLERASARIASARAGSSAAGVLTPTQISADGSWSR